MGFSLVAATCYVTPIESQQEASRTAAASQHSDAFPEGVNEQDLHILGWQNRVRLSKNQEKVCHGIIM
jgi:hypothetical protein